MHKCKVSNLHKIFFNFILSNSGFILANRFFGSISFTNNRDDQKNSTLKTIYKNGNQISEIERNIEYKLIKKKRLTLEEK